MKKRFETPTGSTGTFRPPVCRAEGDETHDGGNGEDNYSENSFP